MCTLAFQHGLSGSSLFSENNTEDQNRRMLRVATALNHHKNTILRQSAQRYEILDQARGQIMYDFSKSILDTKGVPELFEAQYRENLLSLQQDVNTRLATLIHALGASEQRLRQDVDGIYASVTDGLAGELEESRAHSNAVQRLRKRVCSFVRKANSFVRKAKSARSSSSDSSSADSARSDSTLPAE